MTSAEPIRLELPFAAERSTVNAYLFLEPTPTLIDTGDCEEGTWRALVAALATQGLTPADLRRVIITHTHIDHFGQAARLAEETDATFTILDAGVGWLTDFTRHWQRRLDYYRDRFLPGTGMPPEIRQLVLTYSHYILENYRGVPAARVVPIHAGDTLDLGGRDWTALHTPGHAPMLTCFYAADARLLLASDMVLARTPTPVIDTPVDGVRELALTRYLASLTRIEALDVTTVYPGHGPTITDHRKLISKQRARIDLRREECFNHVASGAQTVFELVTRMYPASRTPVNMAGLWMVLGYLDLLAACGRVTQRTVDGTWTYEATHP